MILSPSAIKKKISYLKVPAPLLALARKQGSNNQPHQSPSLAPAVTRVQAQGRLLAVTGAQLHH